MISIEKTCCNSTERSFGENRTLDVRLGVRYANLSPQPLQDNLRESATIQHE